MQFTPPKQLFLRNIIFLFLLISALKTSADEYDMLPVQQNRKTLKLNGAVMAMKEQKWVLTTDTAIYNTVSSIKIDSNFLLVRTEEASFNNNGNIQKLATYSFSNSKKDKTIDSIRYFYYAKDKIAAITNEAGNKQTDSFEFHYTRKGLLDYYRLFNANGSIQYKITYVYKNKKVFTIRKKNADNFAISMIKFFYKDDKLHECQYFDDQFRHVETRRFASMKNSDNNINESYSTSDGNNILKGGITIQKDSLGNILEQSIVDSNRNVSAYYNFKYDKQNNRTSEKVYTDLQQKTIENRYTYDIQNNWTKKEIFTDGILTAIITRNLTYE